jgi:transcriptional regulator with XRE-family HTH domain
MARESRGEKARRQIADLKASGFSFAEIGRQIGKDRSTVMRWAKGTTSPRKGTGGSLTRLWKRTDKALGEGGTVNLTSFFRRVWVKDGEAQLPLTIQPLPTYSFPPNAPVYMLAIFSDWILETGENWPDKVLRVNLNVGDTGGDKITNALLDAMAAQANYPLVYARLDFVLLRRGAN